MKQLSCVGYADKWNISYKISGYVYCFNYFSFVAVDHPVLFSSLRTRTTYMYGLALNQLITNLGVSYDTVMT